MKASDGFIGDAPVLDLNGFRSAVSASFVPLRVSTEDPDSFRGRLRQVEVAGVTFTAVDAGAHVVERTVELLRISPRKYFRVSLQMEGSARLEQGGREISLEQSDIAIYDTTEPYMLRFSGPFRQLVIQMPHERFEIPPEMVGRMTAVRLRGTDGLGKVVSPFLTSLGTDLPNLNGPAGVRLAQNALDLLGLLLANQLDTAKAAADPHWDLVQKIRAHIDEHLGDISLGPATIADANYISTRHLHNVFQRQGTTVSTYVRSRRLEKCYQDLANPLQVDVPIAVIGSRWGFTDAAHFSRIFKTTYGQSPRTVREQILKSG